MPTSFRLRTERGNPEGARARPSEGAVVKYIAVFALSARADVSPRRTPRAPPIPTYIDSDLPQRRARPCRRIRYAREVGRDPRRPTPSQPQTPPPTAYDRCADRYRSAGDAEHLHYASIGSAQYHFAAGHLMRLDAPFRRSAYRAQYRNRGASPTRSRGERRPRRPPTSRTRSKCATQRKTISQNYRPEGTIGLPSATPSAAPSPAATPPRKKCALKVSRNVARKRHKIAAFRWTGRPFEPRPLDVQAPSSAHLTPRRRFAMW